MSMIREMGFSKGNDEAVRYLCLLSHMSMHLTPVSIVILRRTFCWSRFRILRMLCDSVVRLCDLMIERGRCSDVEIL